MVPPLYRASCMGERNSLPASIARRLQHGIGHVVGGKRVTERGSDRRAIAERFEKIGSLMNERMLEPDLCSRHPPVLHVGMVAVGDVNAAPATQAALVAMIEILEPMQVVQMPFRRRALAVDLEGVERLVASR